MGDLAVAGWRRHAALTAAADRTRVNPGSWEVVDLATHRITSVHRPYVELLLNDVHVATVRFELRVVPGAGASRHGARRPRCATATLLPWASGPGM